MKRRTAAQAVPNECSMTANVGPQGIFEDSTRTCISQDSIEQFIAFDGIAYSQLLSNIYEYIETYCCCSSMLCFNADDDHNSAVHGHHHRSAIWMCSKDRTNNQIETSFFNSRAYPL